MEQARHQGPGEQEAEGPDPEDCRQAASAEGRGLEFEPRGHLARDDQEDPEGEARQEETEHRSAENGEPGEARPEVPAGSVAKALGPNGIPLPFQQPGFQQPRAVALAESAEHRRPALLRWEVSALVGAPEAGPEIRPRPRRLRSFEGQGPGGGQVLGFGGEHRAQGAVPGLGEVPGQLREEGGAGGAQFQGEGLQFQDASRQTRRGGPAGRRDPPLQHRQ